MIPTLASWHPFIVHFAIALLFTSFLFDLAGTTTRFKQFTTTGFHLMIIAVPFLLSAVFTGNLAKGMYLNTEDLALIDQHLTLMNAAVWGFMAAASWRTYATLKKTFTRTSMFFYLVVLFLVCISIFVGATIGSNLNHS